MPDTMAAKSVFRRLLLRSILIPIVALALLASVLITQTLLFLKAASWVEHTDEVITRLYQAENSLFNAQSSVRGFLLTGDEKDLAPAIAAQQDLPARMADLREMTLDRPAATNFCDRIVAMIKQWHDRAQERIDERRRTGTPPVTIGSGQAKVIAAEVDELFKQWVDQETHLRAERNTVTHRWAMGTLISTGVVTIVVGVLLSLLSRGQLRWLSSTYESALARSRELGESLERRVKERTDELSTANGRLGEVNKELEAFAYSVSHDLRAPMRHISGFANLLKLSANGKLAPDDVDNLDTIYRTAVLAGRMVDDLLAFSRIGRTQLRNDAVDVDALVKACVKELAPELANRTIEWTIPSLPPTYGDPALLKLVFQNLLSNAVKYTGERETAHIELGSTSEAGGTTYWIKDDGVGFDMTYAHKLFGVFQRLHRAEEFEGTGIGLANVRRIIVRHGGRTWAEGSPGAGATFFIFLPAAGTADVVQSEPEPEPTEAIP